MASESKKEEARAVAKTDKSATEYYVNELAANAGTIFGKSVRSECVIAALNMKHIEKTSVAEAKKILEAFLKKEVNE